MAAPTAVLLLLAAQRLRTRSSLLPAADVASVVVLLTALGVNGQRGSALAVLLIIVYVWGLRRRRTSAFIFGGVAMSVFAYQVVAYRSALIGERGGSVFFTLVRDINPALFTTGSTAAVVPTGESYRLGSTYVAGLLRQVPGPLASSILGPPDDTGAATFRQLLGYENPNQGFGYSVPAEGYLNFGVVGLVVACALVGVVVAWAYRQQGDWSRPIHLLYPLVLGPLPFALRSDFLGLVKGTLYPFLIVLAAYSIARRLTRTRPMLAHSGGVRSP